MKYLKESKFFAGLVFIILIGLAILVYNYVNFIFIPIEAFLTSLLTPILITGFIFYIFLPIYKLIKIKITSDYIALPILFSIIIGSLYLLISSVIPSLVTEVSSLVAYIPQVSTMLIEMIEDFMIANQVTNESVMQSIQNLDISISNLISQLATSVTAGVSSVFTIITRSAIVLSVVPVVLFFLFKEGEKLPDFIIHFTPKKYRELVKKMLFVVHDNAASYIGGKILVCIYVGIASYIIYLVLDIPNALVLAVLCALFDFIPYFGPFIGAAPAFLIALTQSIPAAILLVVLIFVVQMGESYLVSPIVMGKSLHMHPVAVLFILLFTHELFGIFGMIIALPVYAILKSCGKIIYESYKAGELIS